MTSVYQANFAQYYDLMYHWKNYTEEAAALKAHIARHKQTHGNNLLEVACGTGKYIEQLHNDFQITGLDLSENMLTIARAKFPDLSFVCADMHLFQLPQTFDVVLCLFSSIAYAHTIEDVQQVFGNFYQHLNKGGIALIEPFIAPDLYKENYLHAINVDRPDIKLSRQSISTRQGNIAHLAMHTLVTTLENGGQYFFEEHQLALFHTEEYLQAARNVGFEASILPQGLMKDRDLMLLCK